jgi:BirA family biotin operon repressor/biotin-[acetyl-CoA-carboxylase] ligase
VGISGHRCISLGKATFIVHVEITTAKTSMKTTHPPLDLATLRAQLAQSPIGHTLIHHTTIPSTMPIAAELAQRGDTRSGTLVMAEEQSGGRGRRGRTWHAPYASALLTSTVLKSPHSDLPQATLTMVAGNALLAAVAATVPALADSLHLKWPNDLVVGDDPATARKVAGILAESTLNGAGTATYAILGIGINVNQSRDELPRIAPPTPRPTSLRLAQQLATDSGTDALVSRERLLVHLCQQLAEGLMCPPTAIYQQWKSHLATLGHTVAVYAQGVEAPAALVGHAVDVLESGALIVVDDGGTTHTFHAADVSVRVR